MSFARRAIVAVALLSLAAPIAGQGASTCAAVSGAIAGGSVETLPVAADPTGDTPAFCKATGVLQPVPGSRIGFQLWLPLAARWTGRLHMLGNGGYSSALPIGAMRAALARGSAVVATDTGHQGDDPDFARGHPDAIADWGWRAVHTTAVAAKSLTTRFYGRPPEHSYFNGCSTGGHQAMMEAQRFPADFDGIVAGAPGSDRVRLNAAFLWQFRANHHPGDNAAPILNRADLQLLQTHALARCRAANGGRAGGLASDSWLDDPISCRPEPDALACRAGGVRPCLTAEQVRAARAMYAGAPGAGARPATFPWLAGSEPGWGAYWADPARPDQPARVNFWRVWAFDNPAWNWWSFDYRRDLPAVMARLSPVIDATDPDLSAFRDRGGRLLQYHGLADPVVSPLDTLAYRRAVIARDGRDPAAWYRLFLVPGMGHCGGGAGFTRFDTEAAIEAWVERGTAPDRMVAAAADGATRPLCPYPARAVHHSGDPATATSFVCERPRAASERLERSASQGAPS